ncbi:MAG: tetratricopeptide repeat protein [Proteobacteria bacterium]|nr:tetratricopeptide repeat protein [Pseudomonadota bacterium]
MKVQYKILIVAAALIAVRFAVVTDYKDLKDTPDQIFQQTQELLKTADDLADKKDFQKAQDTYTKALELQRDKENSASALILRKMGSMYLEKGKKEKAKLDLIRAESMFQKALGIDAKIDDKNQMIQDYSKLALTYASLGNEVKFRDYLVAQIPLNTALGQTSLNFTVYVPLAALYTLQGDKVTGCKLLLSARTELTKPEAVAVAKQYGLDARKELIDAERQIKELKCTS